jgi:hypothetical protein
MFADRVRTAFRPCAIGDPRGRFLVCATSQLGNNEGYFPWNFGLRFSMKALRPSR